MSLSANKTVAVEYFDFEKDFLDDGIRCIPMIVRFKLDACGIKLKLKEWSRMNQKQRENLATLSIDSVEALDTYRNYVGKTIVELTNEKPTQLLQDPKNLSWMMSDSIPTQVLEKLNELNHKITIEQWAALSILKRYALLKLTRSGHENKNFPKALKEFGLA